MSVNGTGGQDQTGAVLYGIFLWVRVGAMSIVHSDNNTTNKNKIRLILAQFTH